MQLDETVDRPVLATDLDGTWIPLEGSQRNRNDLETLRSEFHRRGVLLIYITGRHFASAMDAIQQHDLPQPDWLICDVGTSIYRREDDAQFHVVYDYWHHQDQIISELPIESLRTRLMTIDGLRLQEQEKQGRFKLSYYVEASRLDAFVASIQQTLDESRAPYSIIHSVDPFNGDGLVDLLPTSVSKAHALGWWVERSTMRRESIVFAGDSGNDLAALTAGYRAILVGNAARSLAHQVSQAHQQANWSNRLYLAKEKATSGVLEGCRWFGLVESKQT